MGAERRQDSKVPMADEPRNAPKMGVLRHRHTATSGTGSVIVLYFPFRQMTPKRIKKGDSVLRTAKDNG
jgi:hypothetical protein